MKEPEMPKLRKRNSCAPPPPPHHHHHNVVQTQDTTHFLRRLCHQRGSPCQDPVSNRSTRRPDHRKKTQTDVVWTCLTFIRSGQKHLAHTRTCKHIHTRAHARTHKHTHRRTCTHAHISFAKIHLFHSILSTTK